MTRLTRNSTRKIKNKIFAKLAAIPATPKKPNANNAGQFAPDWQDIEAKCRSVMELRMRLVPYIHAAFVRYHREGLPAFRALVMDYPNDPKAWLVDDQFLVGESLIVAPAFAGEPSRNVYLPEGEWFDYWTGKRHTGKQSLRIDVPLDQIPIFVKSGSLLPLAEPTLHTEDPASWRLTVNVYGDGHLSSKLYEDDGSWSPSLS